MEFNEDIVHESGIIYHTIKWVIHPGTWNEYNLVTKRLVEAYSRSAIIKYCFLCPLAPQNGTFAKNLASFVLDIST